MNINERINTVLITSTQTTMARVYQWMSIGILLTAMVSLYIGSSPELIMGLMRNTILFYGLMIAQIGIVLGLNLSINRISAIAAAALFFLYSALTGVTLSVIFMVYTAASIQSAFFTTSIGFAGLSAFGLITKKDLGFLGTFCTMGLFGLVGMSLLSFFFPSIMGGASGMVFSMVGLLVFSGLTAYDTQKIRLLINQAYTEEDQKKVAVIGALTLYLDFINLFLSILRLMGNRRD